MTDAAVPYVSTTPTAHPPSGSANVTWSNAPLDEAKALDVERSVLPENWKSPTGTYVLEVGDNPSVVARKLLGRGSLGRDLVLANPGVKWLPGEVINIPEVNS